MDKKNVNIYIELEPYKIVKHKGFNISQICNDAIKAVAGLEIQEVDEAKRLGKRVLLEELAEARAILNQKKQLLNEIEKEEEKKKKEQEKRTVKSYEIDTSKVRAWGGRARTQGK